MSKITLSNMKLEGKIAIITGGASGIGEAVARLFALNGARSIIIADVQDEKGRQVVESIGSNQCTFINCDVTDEQQVKSLVESTVQTHGHLDIMFSNAGILNSSGSNQNILNFDLEASDRVFAVNVRGMTACVKHAALAMVEGGVKGSIVCTASVTAKLGRTKNIDYVMSKHAVLGLVRSASKQLGEYGIRVNCVSPSVVATPMMFEGMKISKEEIEKNFGAKVFKAGHVADAVLFLASEDSVFLTGHDLVIDASLLGFNLNPVARTMN